MNKFIGLLAALVLSFSTQATLISVELDKTNYQVGDTLVAQFVISDIEDDGLGFQRLLADFIFDANFDANLLTLSSVSFGDKLDVDFFNFTPSDQRVDDSIMNVLTVEEFSYADSFDLAAAQDGFANFVLATISFDVISAGNGGFSIDNASFGDDFGDSFTSINLDKAVEFTVTDVPEPASVLLVLMALGFMVTRKKA